MQKDKNKKTVQTNSIERKKECITFIILHLNKSIHKADEKQIIKCKSHFSVFITNKLIIKTTKAVQWSDSLFSFIDWLTLMRQTAYCNAQII